jgi:hypothetical protein
MSWFFVPAAVTLIVAWKWRSEFKSYAAWYLGIMYLAVVVFMAMPMSPPWLADPHVVRILALRWGEVHVDTNFNAAFPSLHVALPLSLALWSLSRRHVRLATGLFLYTAAIAIAVVYLGEHYVIDVMGACAVAGIVLAVDTIVRHDRVARPHNAPSLVQARPRLQPAEHGQNLVEFALMFPIVLFFLMTIVAVGLALHTRSNMQQAVREGARQAAIGATLPQVQNLAAGNAREQLKPENVQWCFPEGPTHTRGRVGDPVTVFISKDGQTGYPYNLVSLGTLNADFYGGALTVQLDPRATTRLERSVPASALSAAPGCPS